MIEILPTGPRDHWYLPILNRIRTVGQEDTEDLNVDLLLTMIQAGMATQPHAWRMLAFVDQPPLADLGRLVGHAIMAIQSDGTKRWVLIVQTWINPHDDTGDAVLRALHDTDHWARAQGAQFYTMATNRETEAWTRKFGFTRVGVIYRRLVPAAVPV